MMHDRLLGRLTCNLLSVTVLDGGLTTALTRLISQTEAEKLARRVELSHRTSRVVRVPYSCTAVGRLLDLASTTCQYSCTGTYEYSCTAARVPYRYGRSVPVELYHEVQ
jgi:hypothetical protein